MSQAQPPVALQPGFYRHYKGGRYQVLQLARHSETEEWLVVYRPCEGNSGWWVRPLLMFVESLEVGGQVVPRFTWLGENGA